MRIVQFLEDGGHRRIGLVEGESTVTEINAAETTYSLVLSLLESGGNIEGFVHEHGLGRSYDYSVLLSEKRVLVPVDHPDPARCWVVGTGLTHLGAGVNRSEALEQAKASAPPSTDAQRLWREGLLGGRKEPGQVGAQPEWFFKGDGSCVVAPEHPLVMPSYSEDGGEEPELVGLYVISGDGTPCRLGFAIGNEFTDHVTERKNYLFLAHSKMRPCSFGPELRVDPIPGRIQGVSRILRANQTLWEKPFFTGGEEMTHSIWNLEYHHFKYPGFRVPGDLHVYFFGTGVRSDADGLKTQVGDVFEMSAEGFGRPLRNPLGRADAEEFRIKEL